MSTVTGTTAPLPRLGRGDVDGLDAGAAWYQWGGAPVRGTVCGVFARASYLRFGERLLALCRADVASGPLHLRVPALPPVRVGDRAVLTPGSQAGFLCLELGAMTVAIRADRRWMPAEVAAQDLRRLAGRGSLGPARDRGCDRDGDALSETGLDAIVDQARDQVAGRDLVGLARLVGGRGPGLTPAGDDLLAGVLVIDALLHPGDGAARQAAVDAAATTDVAAAFLRWAARGQCIEPFHDVVSAMASGRGDLEPAARAVLRATGASSGDALLLGLDLALGRA